MSRKEDAMQSDMHELVGRRIDGVRLAPGDGKIVFETDVGPIWYRAEGDCCSESWFADGIGIDALIGHTVASVNEVPMPDGYRLDDGRSRQEEDSAFGFRFTTEVGRFDLVFRNSSNGYYGGWCELGVGAPPYDAVPVTDDWQR